MESKNSSVQALHGLYSVVAALAMGLALEQLLDLSGGETHFRVGALPLAVAFLFTLVPFYHGAIRHLETTYGGTSRGNQSARLLWDFTILFIEACVLLAAGILVIRPVAFLITMLLLWGIDIVWGLAAQFLLRQEGPMQPWAIVNATAALLYAILLIISNAFDLTPFTIACVLLVLSILRTIADYKVSWALYFPSDSE
jgi:hypothetical protein